MNAHTLAKVLYTVFVVTFMVTAMSWTAVWLGDNPHWAIGICVASAALCVWAFTSIVRLVKLLEARGESL